MQEEEHRWTQEYGHPQFGHPGGGITTVAPMGIATGATVAPMGLSEIEELAKAMMYAKLQQQDSIQRASTAQVPALPKTLELSQARLNSTS